jgi:hypothetical protein
VLLRGYMSEFMRAGVIHHAGRGWYSRLATPFTLNSEPVASLVQSLSRTFPLVGFSCWSTAQNKGAMHHLLSQFVTFLDVVYERNVYPHVDRVPLRTAFLESDGALLVPTVEGLLGDKLTAFGPNTTGVPLNEQRAMQFMKQVFDIGELFNAAGDLAAIRAAYDQVFAAENGFRGEIFTTEQALQDDFNTAYRITQVGFANEPKDGRDKLIEAGRKQIESHLVGVKFRREQMKIAVAKAALLSTVLRAAAPPAFPALRYDETKLVNLKEVKFDTAFSAAGKLKAIPEAMWLWAEALRLRGVTT